MRDPLLFDQLVNAKYLNEEDKTCVLHSGVDGWATAISNNILRAGKHYTTFEVSYPQGDPVTVLVGVMRPGQANKRASNIPTSKHFYNNFSRRLGHGAHNNKVHCCMYYTYGGVGYSSNWSGFDVDIIADRSWARSESMSSGGELGMLLDLDEGTLSVYKNGRKLGVMKRGLAGPYCWVVSLNQGSQVTIKRGIIPPN